VAADGTLRLRVVLFAALLGLPSCDTRPQADNTRTRAESIADVRAEIARIKLRIDLLEADRSVSDGPLVNLRREEIQPIADGFMVADLAVAAEPGGARVSGRLINTQSVGHQSATFVISTEGDYYAARSSEFAVMRLPAGSSARFRVLLMGVNPDSLRFGRISYKQSTVTFQLLR
jgi:hypothetical protein